MGGHQEAQWDSWWSGSLAAAHLSSFFSSPQLRILWRRLAQPTTQRDRSLTYQYKIQDKNVSFFAKGMSPAIL